MTKKVNPLCSIKMQQTIVSAVSKVVFLPKDHIQLPYRWSNREIPDFHRLLKGYVCQSDDLELCFSYLIGFLMVVGKGVDGIANQVFEISRTKSVLW